MFDLMGRTKTVVSPSTFDVAPGILYEASALGCNVVASPNCGNAAICHEALIAADATVNALTSVIRRSLTARFPDRLQLDSALNTGRRLLRLLSALVRLPSAAPETACRT